MSIGNLLWAVVVFVVSSILFGVLFVIAAAIGGNWEDWPWVLGTAGLMAVGAIITNWEDYS